MKRVFRVDFGNYGGELVIGKVTDEFVEYWKDKIKNGQMTHSDNSSKLVNHLRGLEWDDENIDNESPRLKKGDHIPPWNEIDDFEHFWAPYADAGFTVTEVTGLTDEEKYTEDSGEEFDPYGCIYSREAYFDGVTICLRNILTKIMYQYYWFIQRKKVILDAFLLKLRTEKILIQKSFHTVCVKTIILNLLTSVFMIKNHTKLIQISVVQIVRLQVITQWLVI